MSTSFFSPFSSLMDDTDQARKRRMMMAMMLSKGASDQGAPASPFGGIMQGLQSGVGNGLMIADMVGDMYKGDPTAAQHDLSDNAYETTSGLFGQPSAATSTANSAMDEFANGGSSPLSYSFNNFGQGLSNFGYGVGNWFGSMF